jgi:hypothetical protein
VTGESCGCCGTSAVGLREHADNRPSLASIAFRVGTFSSFRESLLRSLVGKHDLGVLRTRASDDYAITLLELWAVVADVISFYQERIANESYLGTAKLRESVGRLVRLIDYELRPGAAATARLVFTLERLSTVPLPSGLRVQSVPGPDEKPQKFETLEPVEAQLALNRVRVFGALEPYEPFAVGSTGGIVLVGGEALAAGESLVLFDALHVERKSVEFVELRDDLLVLRWAPVVAYARFSSLTTRAAPYRRQFRLFGHNAPTTYMSVKKDQTAPGGFKSEINTLADSDFILEPTPVVRMNSFALDRKVEDLAAGAWMVIAQEKPASASPSGFARLARVVDVSTTNESIAPASTVPGVTPPPALTGSTSRVTLDMRMTHRPVIMLGRQRLHVFTIGDDEAIWLIPENATGMGAWASLGGRFDDFVVERLSGDRLAVVARALDGRLWVIVQNSADGTWGDWRPTGSPRVDLFAAAVDPEDNANHSLILFARGPDQALVYAVYNPVADSFGSWSDLDGDIGDVIVGQGGDNRLVIVGRAPDGALRYRVQTAVASWSGWELRTGAVQALLAVERDGDGVVHVFARGADGKLWRISRPPAGSFAASWQSFGGSEVDTLRVIRDGSGRLTAVVRSPSGTLSVITQSNPGGGWVWSSAWTSLPYQEPIEEFSIAESNNNWIVIFARLAEGGTIWRSEGSAAWAGSQWQPIVSILKIAGMLSAARRQNGQIWLFARAKDEALLRNELYQSTSPGWRGLGVPMWPVADLRQVAIYELSTPPISLSTLRYPVVISGGSLYVPLNALDQLTAHRAVLVDDVGGPALPATVSSTAPVDGDLDGILDHLEIALETPLARPLDAASAVLYGNVALASHGETVRPDVLGDADASVAFQRFTLAKKPVTFLAGVGGLASTLDLRVDDVQWTEVPTFYRQPATAQVYISRLRDDDTLVVEFGDGEHGARPPTGAGNVVARYRQGAGLSGRVRANTLTNLLDRPVGLRAATNPLPAEGGADRETRDEARHNAPTKVKTFDRAVSLRDVEDLATTTGEIAKARAALVWDGDVQAVHLTVAGQGGAVPGSDVLARLAAGLDSRRDPNRGLLIAPYLPVPVVISATLLIEARHAAAKVAAQARATLAAALSFDALSFGQSVHLSDVYAVLQGVDGVESVIVDVLQFKGYETMSAQQLAGRGATAAPLQSHLRIFAARANRPPARGALPAEQARLEDAATDITLTTVGGLTE